MSKLRDARLIQSFRSSKKAKVATGVAAFVLVAGLGNTLAANISLNSGNSVEFGQGVARTTACDTSITMTPQVSFVNSTESFDLTSIELSGVDLTPEGTGWDATGSGVTDVTGGYPYEWNNWSGSNLAREFDGVPDSNTDKWDAVYLHPGQYFNGSTWVNTCADKTLVIRAFTEDSLFGSHTRNGTDTDSALCFTSDVAQEAAGVYDDTLKTNCGFGINIHGYIQESSVPTDGTYIQYYGQNSIDLRRLRTEVTGSSFNNTTVTILFNNYQVAPDAAVLDGKWVNKFTIESMAPTSNPTGLQSSRSVNNSERWFVWDQSGL